MALGEYYVICGACSRKVFNTETIKDEDGILKCKEHILEDIFDRRSRVTHIPVIYPKIRRSPQSPATFVDNFQTWEVINLKWEDITDKWEDI